MCGVFGFVSTKSRVCIRTLRRIALANERRGQDAWGIAWIDSRDNLRMYKKTGAIGDSLGMLSIASDAKLLIGHTRFATQGTPAVNDNNHPHIADDGYIVHNGMIPNYRDIISEYGLSTNTQCDSEVLARLIEQFAGKPILRRCIEAATIVRSRPLVMLGLWKPGHLTAIRSGNPLWEGITEGGVYLSSLSNHLPGGVREFMDNKGRLYLAA